MINDSSSSFNRMWKDLAEIAVIDDQSVICYGND